MARRVLLCLSHSIEEYDQLRLLGGLGYDVASIGGYINPHAPHDDKRPALPELTHFPEVQRAVDEQGVEDNLGQAQAWIPDGVLEWLGSDGVIIYHHYLDRLFGQWERILEWKSGGGRVIWRTVGQSVEHNELQARIFRDTGLEIVRYSPKERNIPGYVGEDALIRFYKDPDEWTGWNGTAEVVGNITQDMPGRGVWCNAQFWLDATTGLRAQPAGPGSGAFPGGMGQLSEDDMKQYLRNVRCYLYTGTQPASYTLGLLEAMMTGTPVVSIGPSHMQIFPYGPELFEGHEIARLSADDPEKARRMLNSLLADEALAGDVSFEQRDYAVKEFGMEGVGRAWRDYLGTP